MCVQAFLDAGNLPLAERAARRQYQLALTRYDFFHLEEAG
jgi:hypothetical protein